MRVSYREKGILVLVHHLNTCNVTEHKQNVPIAFMSANSQGHPMTVFSQML